MTRTSASAGSPACSRQPARRSLRSTFLRVCLTEQRPVELVDIGDEPLHGIARQHAVPPVFAHSRAERGIAGELRQPVGELVRRPCLDEKAILTVPDDVGDAPDARGYDWPLRRE